jgi:uroporphyrinogen-III decarboxylase
MTECTCPSRASPLARGEALGHVVMYRPATIAGNVPSGLILTSTAEKVKAYCKKLIDTVGKGGGYIMSNGAFFEEAKPENVKAMVDVTKEYGVYK